MEAIAATLVAYLGLYLVATLAGMGISMFVIKEVARPVMKLQSKALLLLAAKGVALAAVILAAYKLLMWGIPAYANLIAQQY